MRPYTMHQVIVLLFALAAADAGPPRCDISLIKGVNTNKDITFGLPTPLDAKDASAKYLKCKDETKEIVVNSKYYPMLVCDSTAKWKGGSTNIFIIPPIQATDVITIACKTKACHQSLITGFDSAKMTYNGNKLKCKNTANEKIEYTETGKKKWVDDLDCDVATGGDWKNGGVPTSFKNHLPLVLTCSVPACHQSLIIGFDKNKMKYEKIIDLYKLQCKKEYEKVKYNPGPNEAFALECNPKVSIWTNSDAILIPVAVTASITVNGCEINPCDEKLIKGPIELISSGNSGTRVLSCPGNKVLKIQGEQKTFATLTCSSQGWTDGTTASIKRADELFTVICEDPPNTACDVTLITEIPLGSSNLDKTTPSQITCKSGKQLEIGGTKYDTLVCDLTNGWTVPSDNTVKVKEATESFDVKCVEKPSCPRTSTPPDSTTFDALTGKLTCTSAIGRKRIIYNNKKYESLTCTPPEWKDGDTEVAPSTTELAVTCDAEEYCIVQRHCLAASITCIDGVEDGLTADADSNSAGEYACKIKKLGDDKNTMTLNGQNTYSNSLKCKYNEGWTDVTGKTIAPNARTKVKIECEKAKCKSPPVKACGDEPEEYFCDGDSSGRSAVDLSGDPNFLSCEKGPMKILYDFSRNQEYDFKLRCKEEYKWYKSGDTSEKTIMDEDNNQKFLCLRKRCNMCITKLSDLPSTQSTSERTLVPGTAATCATTTCPNNLWRINVKRGVNSGEEEYAGKVACYSEAVGSGFWIIEGEKDSVVTEGSCIDKVSSCLKAAPLKTKCDSSDTSSGCKELTLYDDKQSECDTGKTMYFKRKAEPYYYEGGKTIECVKAKGTWKMAPIDDVLVREDNVICADSNPNPMPTTTPPPTACATCLNGGIPGGLVKETDVNEEDSGSEICTITLKDKGKFKVGEEVTGKLICNTSDRVWKTEEGKVAARIGRDLPKEDSENLMWIIGGAVFGVIVLFIVFAVIFKVCISGRKKPDDKDEETKRKMLEEGKKKKKKAGDNNDEILDEISVDAPSELKL
ncbi:hypothetical protein PENTCL1PPCAC_7465 [Pristionchus entomophagus]|uniref:Uncharacterized protein n=1 Tax=Pristionchus entomophagus TaxID=358040 RepID=A0AAV5SYY0_9BILA|nr:hypothetical protein PENTCL1PPCAC_7465 [Pristionchus entomophagus]